MSPPTNNNKVKKEKKPVEVVIFEDPDKPRKRPPKDDKANKNKSKSSLSFERPVFDQRMAKFDIHKLAMTGMQEEDKEEAMVNYLVELGAKRPKSKPTPMKEYIQELKKKRLEGESKLGDGPDDGNNSKQRRKKRDKKDIFIDGQIGKWKRGVQFINTGKKLQKRV